MSLNAAIVANLDRNRGRFSHVMGFGVDYPNFKTILYPHPSARLILIGTGTNTGQYEWAATFAAGVARLRATSGDHLLFPGGTTVATNGPFTQLILTGNVVPGGVSALYPFRLSTYDPADPFNNSKIGSLYVTIDATADPTVGGWSPNIFFSNGTGSWMHFYKLKIKCSSLNNYGTDAFAFLNVKNGVMIEDCPITGAGISFTVNGGLFPVDSQDKSTFCQNIVLRNTSIQYAMGPSGGNFSLYATYGSRLEGVMLHHGGWGSDVTRATVPAGTTQYTSAAGATSVGAQITVGSTTGMLVGHYVRVTSGAPTGAVTYNTRVISIDSATTFTVNRAPTTVFAGGATVVEGFWQGIDIYRHNDYIGEDCNYTKYFDVVQTMDAINGKKTGGNWELDNVMEFLCPMGSIFDPNGNASAPANAAFPTGSKIVWRNHLQFDTEDAGVPPNNVPRSMGPTFYTSSVGSYYESGLMMVNTNNTSGLNQVGLSLDDHARTIATTMQFRNTRLLNWAGNDTSAKANTTRVDDYNIWGNPASGTNQNQTTLADANIAAALTRNIYQTFRTRYSELSGVTVVNANTTRADQIATCTNVFDYMASNWGPRWIHRLGREFRNPMGLG
jgi:hypothetical protein